MYCESWARETRRATGRQQREENNTQFMQSWEFNNAETAATRPRTRSDSALQCRPDDEEEASNSNEKVKFREGKNAAYCTCVCVCVAVVIVDGVVDLDRRWANMNLSMPPMCYGATTKKLYYFCIKFAYNFVFVWLKDHRPNGEWQQALAFWLKIFIIHVGLVGRRRAHRNQSRANVAKAEWERRRLRFGIFDGNFVFAFAAHMATRTRARGMPKGNEGLVRDASICYSTCCLRK